MLALVVCDRTVLQSGFPDAVKINCRPKQRFVPCQRHSFFCKFRAHSFGTDTIPIPPNGQFLPHLLASLIVDRFQRITMQKYVLRNISHSFWNPDAPKSSTSGKRIFTENSQVFRQNDLLHRGISGGGMANLYWYLQIFYILYLEYRNLIFKLV